MNKIILILSVAGMFLMACVKNDNPKTDVQPDYSNTSILQKWVEEKLITKTYKKTGNNYVLTNEKTTIPPLNEFEFRSDNKNYVFFDSNEDGKYSSDEVDTSLYTYTKDSLIFYPSEPTRDTLFFAFKFTSEKNFELNNVTYYKIDTFDYKKEFLYYFKKK